ncbi:MAG: hypothetical protein JRJ18_11335 [Deltaproteobacteria bacterium]|nr:hypothetical protein [Deltaproteobacteria bacterium]
MPEDPYVELRAFLDRFPLGFPPTPSGVELKILKRLFTPEEASLAVKLSARPEGVEEIAERTGMAPGALEPILDAMARKGLVFKMRRQGKACYNAAPFMILSNESTPSLPRFTGNTMTAHMPTKWVPVTYRASK